MNPIDLFALLLIGVAVVLGFRSGALPQVGGLLGAVAGGAIVVLGLPFLKGATAGIDPAVRAIVVLGGLLLIVALGEGLGSAAGRRAARGLGEGLLGAVDRVAGAALGLAQGILIVWLAGGLFAVGPVPRLASAAQTSVAVRTIDSVLPPPTSFAVQLGRLLDSSGLPDVFVGLEPIPAAPVQLPTDPAAQAIAGLAEPSMVKVVAATCGLQSSGSGFVVARGYVVTNAHVVAGGTTIRIDVSGALQDARPVLVDPELDVAVLYVPGLTGPTLRFAADDPGRGTIGAALGYPGGGVLTVIPGAVTGGYAATGFDIYGQHQVTRRILELRAQIRRGDSGGPLVLSNGTVGGVVFAEARSDPSVGYALSPTEVATRIQPAIGRTSAVPTGSCING